MSGPEDRLSIDSAKEREMPEQKVLLGQEMKAKRSKLDTETAWRLIGWLGLVLGLAGGGDLLLAWYPLDFGSPEWEFATVAQTFSGLPLVTLGIAGVLGAGLALERRWVVLAMGVLLVTMAVLLLLALVIFLLNVPLAIRAAEGVARTGIAKAIVKTLMLGLIFGVGYAAAGIAALRRL